MSHPTIIDCVLCFKHTHPSCKACSSLDAGCNERVPRPALTDCVLCFEHIHIQVEQHAAHWLHAGYKERVSRPEVTEASRFAKYAIAAYGAAGFQYLHQTS